MQWLPVWSASAGVRREGAGRVRPQPGLEHHAARRHGRSAAGLRAVVSRRRDGRANDRAARATTTSSGGSRTRCASRATRRTSKRSTRRCPRVGLELERPRRPPSCSTASSGAATTRCSCSGSSAGCSPRDGTAAGATRRRTPRRSNRSSRYYRKFEADVPDMTATVALGARAVGTATFRGRSSTSQQVQLAMPDLLRQVPAGAERDLASRARAPAASIYTPALQYAPTEPPPAVDQGMRVERRYERFVENGAEPGGDDVRGGRSDPRDADDHAAAGAALRRGHRPAARRRRSRRQLVPHDGVRSGARTPSADDPATRRRGGASAAASITSRSTTTASSSSRRASAKAATSSRISCARRRPARSGRAGTTAEEMYAPEVKRPRRRRSVDRDQR